MKVITKTHRHFEKSLATSSEFDDTKLVISALVEKIVDHAFGVPDLQKFLVLKDQSGFEFKVLRSYVYSPGNLPTFVPVKSGNFTMGPLLENRRRNDDELAHDVKLGWDIEIQQTEVTQAQWLMRSRCVRIIPWKQFLGMTPNFF